MGEPSSTVQVHYIPVPTHLSMDSSLTWKMKGVQCSNGPFCVYRLINLIVVGILML